MATRGDAVQAAQETARLGISTVVEGVATGIIEIGAATPVVAPLCVALLKAKGIVDGASRNKEELAELCERCDLVTVQVIDKAKASNTSTIDVSPLQGCVDKLDEVAKRYHDQGCLARLAQFRRDGDDIQRLRARIEAVVPIMGLAGVVNIMDRLEDVRQMVVRLSVSRGNQQWGPGRHHGFDLQGLSCHARLEPLMKHYFIQFAPTRFFTGSSAVAFVSFPFFARKVKRVPLFVDDDIFFRTTRSYTCPSAATTAA